MKKIEFPYVGIRPFEMSDWPIFFGRQSLSNQLLHKLETNRFVAVIGSSGSGKSSVVKAGLLPIIEELGMMRNAKNWVTLACRPGGDPWASLSSELVALERRFGSASNLENESVARDLVRAELRKSDRGVMPSLERLHIPGSTHILLFIDQFEELFRYRLGAGGQSAGQEEAERFVKCVLDSCDAPVGPRSKDAELPAGLAQRIWVVLTMRSDFIGHCEVFPKLSKKVSQSQFLVPVLEPEQKREAIVGPSVPEDITGATYKHFDFEEGLVSSIINESGSRIDQLPLMQHALMRTWKIAVADAAKSGGTPRLTLENWRTAGGIALALNNDADAALKALSPNNAENDDDHKISIARRLFLLLCDVAPDGQITRRRPQVQEVLDATGASLDEVEEIVRVFQADNRNFLLPALDQRRLLAKDYLDISHESLLRQWRRFAKTWLVQEREDAAELRRLVQAAGLKKQEKGGFLPDEDIHRVIKWRDNINKEWIRRYVSAEEWTEAENFIEESSKNQKRIQRRTHLTYGSIIALVFLLLIGVGVMFASENANKYRTRLEEREKIDKEEALRNYFVNMIGVSGDLDWLSPGEVTALWKLAALSPDDSEVRNQVITNWFETEDSVRKAVENDGRGLHAAVGIDPNRKEWSMSKATDLAKRLAATLEKQTQTDAENVNRFAFTLSTLIKFINPESKASIAKLAVGKMVDALEHSGNPYPNYSVSRYVPDAYSNERLRALVAEMKPADVADVATSVVTTMEKSETTNLNMLLSLGNALVVLDDRLGSDTGASLATRGGLKYVEVLARAGETDDYMAQPLYKSLDTTLVKLAAQANKYDPAAQRLGKEMISALQFPADTNLNPPPLKEQLKYWSRIGIFAPPIAELASHLDPEVAGHLVMDLNKALDNVAEIQSINSSDTIQWGKVMGALGNRIESQNGRIPLVSDLLKPEKQPAASDDSKSIAANLAEMSAIIQPFAQALTEARRTAESKTNTLDLESIRKVLKATLIDPEFEKTADAKKMDKIYSALQSGLFGEGEDSDDYPEKNLSTQHVAARGFRHQAILELLKHITESDVVDVITDQLVGALTNAHNDRVEFLGQALAILPRQSKPISAILSKSHELALELKDAVKTNSSAPASYPTRGSTNSVTPQMSRSADVLSISAALAALAPFMDQPTASSNALEIVESLESSQLREDATFSLEAALASLMGVLPTDDAPKYAARGSKVLINRLQNHHFLSSYQQLTIFTTSLHVPLSLLAKHMNRADAADQARTVATMMELQMQGPGGTYEAEYLAWLGQTLTALTPQMEPSAATRLVARVTGVLLKVLQDKYVDNPSATRYLGNTLTAMVAQLGPTARHNQLFAISAAMLAGVSPAPLRGEANDPATRQAMEKILSSLSTGDFVDMLKWPFCLGGAQTLILKEIQNRAAEPFDGNVWKFVGLVKDRSIPEVDPAVLATPATRPDLETALAEAKGLAEER